MKKVYILSLFFLLFLFVGFVSVQAMQNQKALYKAIFVHGLGDKKDAGIRNYASIIGCPIIGRNGPEWDWRKHGQNIGPLKSCLGQEGDIDVVCTLISEQLSKNANQKNILLGVSKGGATIFNTIGWLVEHKPDLLDSIKMVIIESSFAVPENVGAYVGARYVNKFFEEKTKSSSKDLVDFTCCGSCFGNMVSSIIDSGFGRGVIGLGANLFVYKNYKPNGRTPLKSVTTLWGKYDEDEDPIVNRNMPIVLIHSQTDEMISINDSRILYIELKKLGFNCVYLIETQEGKHAGVCWHPNNKDDIFQKMCLIYFKHKLPLIPELSDEDGAKMRERGLYSIQESHAIISQKGKELLLEMQPAIEQVLERIKFSERC